MRLGGGEKYIKVVTVPYHIVTTLVQYREEEVGELCTVLGQNMSRVG